MNVRITLTTFPHLVSFLTIPPTIPPKDPPSRHPPAKKYGAPYSESVANTDIIDQMSPVIRNARGIPISSRYTASQTKPRAATAPDIIKTLPRVVSLIKNNELNIVDTTATTINIPQTQRILFLQLSLGNFSISTTISFVPIETHQDKSKGQGHNCLELVVLAAQRIGSSEPYAVRPAFTGSRVHGILVFFQGSRSLWRFYRVIRDVSLPGDLILPIVGDGAQVKVAVISAAQLAYQHRQQQDPEPLYYSCAHPRTRWQG